MNADRFVALVMAAPTPTPKPAVEVSGVMSLQTTWQSDHDYLVTGDLQIASGATLIIEP
jgi:hypothetical protein